MRTQLFSLLITALFCSSHLIAQTTAMVTVEVTIDHSPDNAVVALLPTHAEVNPIVRDTFRLQDGKTRFKFAATKPGLLILTNNYQSVQLYVHPNQKYTVHITTANDKIVNLLIKGKDAKASQLLNHELYLPDPKQYQVQLSKQPTLQQKDSLLNAYQAEKIAHVQAANTTVSKEFTLFYRTQLSVWRIAALTTDYYFLFRKTRDGKDEALLADFKKTVYPAWKKLYSAINTNLSWLSSNYFSDVVMRYYAFCEIENTWRLDFSENIRDRNFETIKSNLKGSIKEAAMAGYIYSIYSQLQFQKQLIGYADAFTAAFPKSKYKKYVTDIKNNVRAYHKNLEENDPQVVIIDQVDSLKNYQALFSKITNGKLTYVDLWATWCLPCRKEMMISVEDHHEFDKLGVQSTYLSLDNQENKDAWKAMVKSMKLKGINVLLNEAMREALEKDLPHYSGIPRYLIVAPDGTVLNWDALRPSDKAALWQQLLEYKKKLNL